MSGFFVYLAFLAVGLPVNILKRNFNNHGKQNAQLKNT